MIPIVFTTVGILKLGLCTLGLLEVIIGCWNSIFLYRRRLLSLLFVSYEALQRGEKKTSVIRLSSDLKDELLLCVALALPAATNLRTADIEKVFASDASSWGWAVVASPIPKWLACEIHCHKLRKNVWACLLSPLKGLQRSKGLLAADAELPDGEVFNSHPLWIELSEVLQFELVSQKKTREGRHINVDELTALLETEGEACSLCFPSRFFGLADSQVALAVILKGRSSSIGLNMFSTAVVALALGLQYGWCLWLHSFSQKFLLTTPLCMSRFDVQFELCLVGWMNQMA